MSMSASACHCAHTPGIWHAPRCSNSKGDHVMARLSNQANLGYVPLPETAAPMIASYIRLPDQLPQQARIFDPCAGEGRALEVICDALRIPKAQRYGCELHDARAVAAQ